MVDLVDDEVAAAGAHRGRQRRQLRQAERGARRVGRRGHHRPHRIAAPVGGHQLSGELVAGAGVHRYQLATAFNQAHEMTVAGIARICQQHAVARVQQQCAQQQQGTGGTRRDKDARRRNIQPVLGPVVLRQGLAQGRQARRLGVVGMALRQRPATGLHDRRCGGEVGGARGQVHDIPT